MRALVIDPPSVPRINNADEYERMMGKGRYARADIEAMFAQCDPAGSITALGKTLTTELGGWRKCYSGNAHQRRVKRRAKAREDAWWARHFARRAEMDDRRERCRAELAGIMQARINEWLREEAAKHGLPVELAPTVSYEVPTG